jgi:hypothetical protein
MLAKDNSDTKSSVLKSLLYDSFHNEVMTISALLPETLPSTEYKNNLRAVSAGFKELLEIINDFHAEGIQIQFAPTRDFFKAFWRIYLKNATQPFKEEYELKEYLSEYNPDGGIQSLVEAIEQMNAELPDDPDERRKRIESYQYKPFEKIIGESILNANNRELKKELLIALRIANNPIVALISEVRILSDSELNKEYFHKRLNFIFKEAEGRESIMYWHAKLLLGFLAQMKDLRIFPDEYPYTMERVNRLIEEKTVRHQWYTRADFFTTPENLGYISSGEINDEAIIKALDKSYSLLDEKADSDTHSVFISLVNKHLCDGEEITEEERSVLQNTSTDFQKQQKCIPRSAYSFSNRIFLEHVVSEDHVTMQIVNILPKDEESKIWLSKLKKFVCIQIENLSGQFQLNKRNRLVKAKLSIEYWINTK